MLARYPIPDEKLKNPPPWKPCDTQYEVKSKLDDRKDPVPVKTVPEKPFTYYSQKIKTMI